MRVCDKCRKASTNFVSIEDLELCVNCKKEFDALVQKWLESKKSWTKKTFDSIKRLLTEE